MGKCLRNVVVGVLVLVSAVARAHAGPPPNFAHVYIIVMENHEFSDIIGNPSAPYINSLAQQYALGTAYTALTHPSLPNYMALTGGNTFFTDDCVGCTVAAPSIADQIESSGRRWKAYMEDMPAACTTTEAGDYYTTHHNPFVHYAGIVFDAARCQSHVVPLTDLGGDLAAGTVPDYVWITPDLCSDMHDCTIATGDAWLSAVVPYIINTNDFSTSVLFILWDEGTSSVGGGGVVPMLVVSPLAQKGFQSAAAETHYSLLRTIEDAWGLPALGQAASATSMTEYFTSGQPDLPGAPTDLVEESSGSTVFLSWKAPTTGGPPTTYVLQAGSAPGLTDIGSALTGSLATSLTINNVPAGTYYLQVAAQNGAGMGAPSNQVATPVLVPGAPTNLTSTVSGTSVTLAWLAPTGGALPTTYVIEVGSAPGLADLGSGPTGSLATTFTSGSVAPGTYYVRIRAQNSAGSSAPSNDAAVTITGTAARNLLTSPFSTDSIWNMPVGSRAVYGATGLSQASAVYGDVDYFYVLRASDPIVPLFDDENLWSGPRCASTRPTGMSLSLPATLIVPDTAGSDTPNNAAAFLLPDGHTLEQVNALARCATGGPIYGVPAEQNGGNVEDLYGSGITGGHAGSNLSSIGGTIRIGELTGATPIQHALKIEVDGSFMYYSPLKPGFEWPATTADACAATCYTGNRSGMVEGALLAIPPGATEQTLGLTTAPGRQLFHALQDYGAYIVDNSADVSYNIAVESGLKTEFRNTYGYDFDASSPSPWLADIAALFATLRVVTNNTPTSIGGGGVPRAALAPPVASGTSAGIAASLSASSTVIAAGQSAILTWVVSGGTAVIDQGIGSAPLTGSVAVSPQTTTTYTLSASTNTGTLTRSVTIAVQ
jgi:hypothetical protein